MATPAPLARVQQILGVPEHPCEFILRNGAIICPYEEMEVRFFPEHAGLYFLTLVGEPYELLGEDGSRVRVSLKEDRLPIITSSTEQNGIRIEQTAFACLLGKEDVVDGTEPLVCLVRMRFTNTDHTGAHSFPVGFSFGNCFRPQTEPNTYWKTFLLRDDVAVTLADEGGIPAYPYPLLQKNGMLVAEGHGIVFSPDAALRSGSFIPVCKGKDSKEYRCVWQTTVELAPGEMKELSFRLPYLPLAEERAAELAGLDFAEEMAKTTARWEKLLSHGASMKIPGTRYGNLWDAQTAYTFMLIDRQNKGSPSLYGREMFSSWAGNYPDHVLSYMHLSPTLYEFIWAQESGYWVIGALDLQGYHDVAERCLETFFALQGNGTPGVNDVSILPKRSEAKPFVGTTPHSWLNSNGGVLSAIARHYRLTQDKAWIIRHHDAIISACRWEKLMRASTADESAPAYRGLMPRGQSTDVTFASGHLQWYYTDIGTIMGLYDILCVMRECGFSEYDEFLREYDDYRSCLLRSLDASVLDIADFHEDVRDYDYSNCLFAAALPASRITERDESGMPTVFDGKVFSRSEAEELGIRCFVPMSPQMRIPFKYAYLDMGMQHAFGYLAEIIDFSDPAPLFEGARHSAKDIWDSIVYYAKCMGLYDVEKGLYSPGFPYNDYILNKQLFCDEVKPFSEGITFLKRYACDDESFVMIEYAGSHLGETWFQPCPFALSMAVFRSWLRKALLFEDHKRNILVVGKAVPQEWMEKAMSYEEPISLANAPTEFGPVSLSINASLIHHSIIVSLKMHDLTRLPHAFEIRPNHPQGLVPVSVQVNGGASTEPFTANGVVVISADQLKETELEVIFCF